MKWLRILALAGLATVLLAHLWVQWQENKKDIRMLEKASDLMKEAAERSWGKIDKK